MSANLVLNDKISHTSLPVGMVKPECPCHIIPEKFCIPVLIIDEGNYKRFLMTKIVTYYGSSNFTIAGSQLNLALH